MNNKSELLNTLSYYNVNTVRTYKLKDFIHNPHYYYKRFAIRTLEPNGKFFPDISSNDVFYYNQILEVPFIICDSLAHFDKHHLICNGEVELYFSKFNTYEYRGKVGKGRTSLRETFSHLHTIPRQQIPDSIIDFIWTNHLFNTVVEFSLYNVPVGIKNSPLVIWEIRRY